MFDLRTRILIIDDMLMMRTVIKKTLIELGFENLLEAADGAVGWEIIRDTIPPIELVISDWNMPNTTGLHLLQRVRSSPEFQKLPFILVTAESDKDQVTEALKSGVSNYIVKPFTAQILKEKLKAVHKKINLKS